jgi:ADP-ribosylglycohydrolase
VTGRALEHAALTHRSITVAATITILTSLLLDLWAGMNVRDAIDIVSKRMRPPMITGRQQCDSYVQHRGPGNISKHEKWMQHMYLDNAETVYDFIHRIIDNNVSDFDVAGWGDEPNSRLSTACYCEQAMTVVLFLAYKYHDNMALALEQNVALGGHSTARGAVLGAILGASAATNIPHVQDLCAKTAIDIEVTNLLKVIPPYVT